MATQEEKTGLSDSEEDADTMNIHYKNTAKSRVAKKRKRQTIVILILFFIVAICIISMLAVMDKKNTNQTQEKTEMCHYADNIYPIDIECGVQHCINNNLQRSFSLKYGWSNSLIHTRNKTAIDMLEYLDVNYNIYPNILELKNNNTDNIQYMKYKNISIQLSSIHLSIEYFCCYNDDQYNEIMILYQNYTWQPFDIWFDDLMCLNLTNSNKTIHVLLVNDQSQQLMSDWTDRFEQYLENNGVILLSKPRRFGQPFHSTFAIFDIYDDHLEILSVDTLNYLNEKYSNLWKTIPVTFSKENIQFI